VELKDEFDRGLREIVSHTPDFCMLLVNRFSTVEVESLLWGLLGVGTTHLFPIPGTSLNRD